MIEWVSGWMGGMNFYFIIFFACQKKTKKKKRHLQQGIFYSVYDEKKNHFQNSASLEKKGLNLGAFALRQAQGDIYSVLKGNKPLNLPLKGELLWLND